MIQPIPIYRNGTAVQFIRIDERTVYTHEIMGRHDIRVEFVAQAYLDIRPDDYIIFRDERFSINVKPTIEKRSNFEYFYIIDFESAVYWLKDKTFRHLEAVEFSYHGTAADFIALIVSNMNEIDIHWEVGTVDATESKTIQFIGEERGFTCKGALMKIAEEFGLEFWLTNKTIHLTRQAGSETNLDFEYGRGRGLYTVERGALEHPLYNRIYGFGGTKNIPYTYRNGAKRLVFEGRALERALLPGERRRETSIIFDDIYPQRTSTFTEISEDWLELTDPTLDFDLNDHLIEGEEAKIVFQNGELSGKEYQIEKYNHSTKVIKIIPFTEEDGYITPNPSFFPKPDDKYTLIGISLPESYVIEAEDRLVEETTRVFNIQSRPPYRVTVDPHYMRTNGVTVNAGDRVRLRDNDLQIDDMIRVTSVSFPLVEPDNVTLEISDSILYTNEVLQEIDRNKIKTEIVTVDRTKAELARRNMVNLRRMQGMIYDPDGYFDPENIKPGSIETGMLAVGVKSQNYGLNGVAIEANYQGNPNSLRVSGGSLVHYEIEIQGLGYVWVMTSNLFEGLNPSISYYLYARCSKTALTGTWVLSETPLTTEQEAGFFHFWVGILFTVNEDGYRGFNFTKGMTFIVGDQITTGRIQSLDGLNFFDLSQGAFKLGDEDQGLDWGVTQEGQLTINGALVSKMVFAEDAEIINLIVKSIRTNLTGKRIEILESGNNLKFYDQDGNLVLQIDDDIDSGIDEQSGMFTPRAGIRITAGTGMTSYVTANGLFSNASGYSFLPAIFGIETNASVVGILNRRNTDVNGISAGVVGIDNTSTGNSASYGGYFNSAFIGGMNMNVQTTTTSILLSDTDYFISCYNTSPINVTLPSNPKKGRIFYIRKNNEFDVTILGNGNQIVNDSPVSSIQITGVWSTAVLMWDGSYWMYNVLPRQ